MTTPLKPYPKMKDSGVEWLGEVPEHWELQRGKNLFTKMDRPVHESNEVVTCFRDGTVTLRKKRRTQGFTESLKEIGYQGIRRGDLVIHAMDAFAGAIGVSDSDGKGSPVYAVCKPKDNTNSYYHAYLIREMSRSQWILALATGIRERSTDFRFGTYARETFPSPPLPEQTAIVRYLDYMDRRIRRLIRAKRKLITLLNEQKQVIIHHAVTRGPDPNVPLKDTGVEWLGMVPEHWEVVRIKQITDIQGGYAFSAESFGRVGIPVVRMNNIRRGVLDFENVVRIPEYLCKKSFSLSTGDIVYGLSGSIGATGSLGNYAIVRESDIPAQLNQRVARFIPNLSRIARNFLIESLKTGSFYEQVLAKTTGTAQFNVSTNDIGIVFLALPHLNEQEDICDYLNDATSTLDATITRAQREIDLLTEYRTRLIADVVTGKVDVREVAAGLPEVDPLAGVDEVEDGLNGKIEDEVEDFEGLAEEVEA